MGRPRTPIGVHGAISTRKDGGTWQAQTRVRDPDGHSRPVRARGKSEGRAVTALLKKVQTRHAQHGGVLRPDSTVEVAAKSWLIELRLSKRAAGTVERYEWVLKSHVVAHLGRLALHEVTPGVVTRWLRNLSGNRKMARIVLSHVMKHAVIEGAVPYNVVPLAAPLSEIADQPRTAPPRSLRPHELAAVRVAIRTWEATNPSARTLPLADLVLLQLATGLRVGELLALAWSSVDLDRGLLVVEAGLTMPKGGVKRTLTKTSAADRTIQLPQIAIAMLRQRHAEANFRIVIDGEHPVFPSNSGTWMWPHNLRRAWREARELSTDVDLTWVRLHTFRKTAGTEVIEARGIIAGSKLLGHSSTNITETSYWDRHTRINDVATVLDELLAEWT